MTDQFNNEFNLDDDVIYLNHAAVAPWPVRTEKAVNAFCRENVTIGSKKYANWLNVEAHLKNQLAQLIQADNADEIALVKNTSEALSFVAYGLDWAHGDTIVTSDEEFPSNMIPWESLENQGVRVIKTHLKDTEDPTAELIKNIDSRTKLLTISSVQYASGLRVDLERLGEACQQRGVLFCIDAIQSVGAFPIDVKKYQADFVMADGHKWMLGPEGLGFFYCRQSSINTLKLTQYGWHMVEDMGNYDALEWSTAKSARRFECGSPNMLSIHALSASLSLLLEVGMNTVANNLIERGQYVIDKVQQSPSLTLLTKPDAQGNNIIVFKPTKHDTNELFDYLTSQQVVCAKRGGGIRFSPHFYTPFSIIDRAFTLINRFLTDT
ncbi:MULTISPECIES: aminotransferase class V-fold PLP-dependent enzyme [Cycloclasticus]|jgi:selenocysteine lyase/cysteine desulfurase|uniref:aminotransferase class V-fold PLP-dependent enzyme n=1 Tax=Cycloclasticus TaxID=34067 RepID=UPI000286AB2A|nr:MULTISPECIES: aminotransferase class V-fold PLP-dependent enzyme [Cycloclasticus]AFT67386.1 Aminotransferase, class V [Cycloclasticus sp. P1]SHI38798.1 Selenocysteine lyase/Cysteine desulfurase [Cycloclasticus pugetii]